MPLLRALSLPALGLLLVACGTTTTERLKLPPLETVSSVDLERYSGTWYEIAAFPQRFQEGCTDTTATYEPREDGEIDVTNRCRKDGELDTTEGRARVVDPETRAKLEVSFFPLIWGEYWIIDLSPDYRWAVVGHPSRDYLWILSRTPTLDEGVLQGIQNRLDEKGYRLERLIMTPQSAADDDSSQGAR
ncbi:MAG TPA: lipocalin family protein [Myxococcaceae bacterium]|nr:lipocalin family protein [Myxococcaceae bacterium]